VPTANAERAEASKKKKYIEWKRKEKNASAGEPAPKGKKNRMSWPKKKLIFWE
jgi:hypothetical protein